MAPTLETLAARFRELTVVPPQNLHLTLAFLGELDDASVERARETAAAAAGRVGGAWTVDWGTAGAFPSLARARVLWLGLEDPAPAVRAQAVLADCLRAAGLPIEDRRYQPHLTLARLRSDLSHERADELKEALAVVPRLPASMAASLVLYRSRLGRGRPSVYEELQVALLR